MTVYVRVKDPETGHQFDVTQDHPLLAAGLLVPLRSKRWPDSEQPRPPLHHIPKTSPATGGKEEPAAARDDNPKE